MPMSSEPARASTGQPSAGLTFALELSEAKAVLRLCAKQIRNFTMRCGWIVLKVLIHEEFTARFIGPLASDRPRGGRLIEGFSPKLKRRVRLFSHASFA
jgi:hypothetical protein